MLPVCYHYDKCDMSAIVIKNLPSAVHRKLKDIAAAQHRSMTQQALVFLEESIRLAEAQLRPLPPPFKGRLPLTDKVLTQAKRERR